MPSSPGILKLSGSWLKSTTRAPYSPSLEGFSLISLETRVTDIKRKALILYSVYKCQLHIDLEMHMIILGDRMTRTPQSQLQGTTAQPQASGSGGASGIDRLSSLSLHH